MSGLAAIERITSVADLDEFLAASSRGPVVLLKHSTRCPVSSSALGEIEDFARGSFVRVGAVYVVEERDLSNEISQRFGIRHESPQVFVIRAGQVRWHGSHGAIVEDAVSREVLAAS